MNKFKDEILKTMTDENKNSILKQYIFLTLVVYIGSIIELLLSIDYNNTVSLLPIFLYIFVYFIFYLLAGSIACLFVIYLFKYFKREENKTKMLDTSQDQRIINN